MGDKEMSEGVAIAHSYAVCYKFLLTDTKRYFPTLNTIAEEKDFFNNIASNSTGTSKKLYENIVEVLEYACINDIGLKEAIKCEEGFANITLLFKNRISLDNFEKQFIRILIH